MADDIQVEIDGKPLTAKNGQMIIQVADEAGIYIPRFCYHKHLPIAANCRMCLVEVEKSPKALPACATPCMPGMKVFTKSQKTLDAQRAVMEFLLVNHPLDCPVCDQGGECELQDLSMGYGQSKSDYTDCKHSTPIQDFGPLIASEMTRCISCSRCVRFGDDIAGMRELGMTQRGGHTEVTTYVKEAIRSEVSGNIIDLCPVGALTNKPYRFTARTWELTQAPSVAPHDCLGSNLNIHTRRGTVMRVVARENAAINETWISDRDRFSHTGLYHEDRLKEPMAKIEGEWRPVDWQTAFEMASEGLHNVIVKHGVDHIGALASPNSTVEEFYLLQKIMRGLGSSHVDHRLREIDTRDQAAMGAFPGMGASLSDLEQADAVLLIGSNLQKEQPLAALRLRKAIKKGGVVGVVNSIDYQFNFEVKAKAIIAPQDLVQTLSSADQHCLQLLQDKQRAHIILGAQALHHPQAAQIRYLAQEMAKRTGATLSIMTDGANSAGAWLAGAIPHRQAGGSNQVEAGLSAHEMLAKPRKAYILLNVEPDLDCANTHQAVEALKQAQFVVALSSYRNAALEATANVIFPVAPFTETSGTFVNAMGAWQSFTGVAEPYGTTRPAWKILRVLGNFLHLDDFDYESSEAIKHEVKTLVEKMPAFQQAFTSLNAAEAKRPELMRLGELPIYSVDSLVRHATPLQEAQAHMEGDVAVIKLHPDVATAHQLQTGDQVTVRQQATQVVLPVVVDARVARGAAWIAGGIAATQCLGDLFGQIEIKKGA